MWTERSQVGSSGWLPTSRYGYTYSHQLGLGASPLAMVAPDTQRISWNYCHSTPETRSCVAEQRCQNTKTEVNPESNPSWPLLVKLNLSPFDHSCAAFLRANLLKYGIIVSQCSVGVCHCFIRSTKGTRSPMALDYGCSEDRSVLANGGASPSSCAFHQS